MSKPHDITVIAGLSGVGKTHVITELKKYSDVIIHFSAGSLIKKRRAAMNRDQLRLLSSNEILQNQYVLIEQLTHELKSISEHSLILFDAHMVIDTEDEVLEIPFEIFEQLNPSRFILLHDEPATILSRRATDASRTRPQRSVKQLDEQQKQSLKLAENYAHRLSVPFIAVSSNNLHVIKDKLLT